MKNNFKPISMKCTEKEFDKIKLILEKNGFRIQNICPSWGAFNYLTNNFCGIKSNIANVSKIDTRIHNRDVFEEWDQEIFLQYCSIETNKNNMGYKTTVPVTDVLRIHAVACETWKTIIVDKYLSRIDKQQNIMFLEGEVDAMFLAATTDQRILLRAIFGEKTKPVIDYDRLKTGSKVKIKRTGYHCNGFENLDVSKPVDIVFYKTPHFISSDNLFESKGAYNSYITFNQKGKIVLFSSYENIDYITEVIEY
jgi:hypothetical protein